MNEFLSWLLDTVQGIDPAVRTLLAGLAMMLETSVLVGLIVPGDTVVIVVGTAVTSPLEGVVLGVAVVVGALMGESLGFWLGRLFGPRIRHSRLGRRVGERNWRRSELYLARRGGPAIFISRFLPVLHSLVPLTVGMGGYSYRRFLAWTTPACVLWASLYISVSSIAAGTYREIAGQVRFAAYIFIGIIVLFLVVVFVGKKLLERSERRHFERPENLQEPARARALEEDVED